MGACCRDLTRTYRNSICWRNIARRGRRRNTGVGIATLAERLKATTVGETWRAAFRFREHSLRAIPRAMIITYAWALAFLPLRATASDTRAQSTRAVPTRCALRNILASANSDWLRNGAYSWTTGRTAAYLIRSTESVFATCGVHGYAERSNVP